jgi:hypothetical protein
MSILDIYLILQTLNPKLNLMRHHLSLTHYSTEPEPGTPIPCSLYSINSTVYPNAEPERETLNPELETLNPERETLNPERETLSPELETLSPEPENGQVVEELRNNLWLDKSSRELHVKCFVYNGNLEVPCYPTCHAL